MEKVGFFVDRPALERVVDLVDVPMRVPLASYLDSGTVVVATPALCFDLLNSSVVIPNGNSVLTDGLWVWPGSLSYYVKEYGVGLPDSFLSHAKGKSWIPGRVDEYSMDEIIGLLAAD